MDKDKTAALVLLDLCAFACFLDGGEDIRGAFETAYRLAEQRHLPGIETYRDLVRGIRPVGVWDERCKEN